MFEAPSSIVIEEQVINKGNVEAWCGEEDTYSRGKVWRKEENLFSGTNLKINCN